MKSQVQIHEEVVFVPSTKDRKHLLPLLGKQILVSYPASTAPLSDGSEEEFMDLSCVGAAKSNHLL